jgi:hypothetical protein
MYAGPRTGCRAAVRECWAVDARWVSELTPATAMATMMTRPPSREKTLMTDWESYGRAATTWRLFGLSLIKNFH